MTKLLALLSILALTACGDTQQASYMVTDARHSLTLSRQQNIAGGEWTTDLIVAHVPDCQRRHAMPALTGDKVKLDVYRPEPGVFILNFGKQWYVTELKSCAFQPFKTPPPEPGDLIGGFAIRDGKLEYKSLEAAAGAVSPAPISATRR